MRILVVKQFYFLLVHYMKLLCKTKFGIFISTKTLFYTKIYYDIQVRNDSVPQSKIRKTFMKQKKYVYLKLLVLIN